MTILVGKKAPDFTAAAVMANGEINNDFNLHNAIQKKYGIVTSGTPLTTGHGVVGPRTRAKLNE